MGTIDGRRGASWGVARVLGAALVLIAYGCGTDSSEHGGASHGSDDSGVQASSYSSHCVNARCEVSLNGDSDHDVSLLPGLDTSGFDDTSDEVNLRLARTARHKSATLEVDGRPHTCKQGADFVAAQVRFTCKTIGDGEIDLVTLAR